MATIETDVQELLAIYERDGKQATQAKFDEIVRRRKLKHFEVVVLRERFLKALKARRTRDRDPADARSWSVYVNDESSPRNQHVATLKDKGAAQRLIRRLQADRARKGKPPARFELKRGRERAPMWQEGYYTVSIPYVTVGQTQWHPTDPDFAPIQRGTFRSKAEAHAWARSHLRAYKDVPPKYTVKKIPAFQSEYYR